MHGPEGHPRCASAFLNAWRMASWLLRSPRPKRSRPMRRSFLPLFVAAAMALSAPALADQPGCPPGSWFCADADVNVNPPARPAARAPPAPADAAPAAPVQVAPAQRAPTVIVETDPGAPP